MARNTSIGPEYYEPLPSNLRRLMDAFDIKNKHLADYLGVSGTAVGNYLKGTDKPDWKAIVKIADFFHVTTDYLLGRQQAPFFESPDLEEIGFTEKALFSLKSLATERLLEEDPEGFYHSAFDEFDSFLSSNQFLIFFSLLSRAKTASTDSRKRIEELLLDDSTSDDADTEFLRYKSVIATEEVKNGYMFARYQVDRQLRELLDDYFGEKEACLLLKQLEQKMAAQRKSKTKKTITSKAQEEDHDGNHHKD